MSMHASGLKANGTSYAPIDMEYGAELIAKKKLTPRDINDLKGKCHRTISYWSRPTFRPDHTKDCHEAAMKHPDLLLKHKLCEGRPTNANLDREHPILKTMFYACDMQDQDKKIFPEYEHCLTTGGADCDFACKYYPDQEICNNLTPKA